MVIIISGLISVLISGLMSEYTDLQINESQIFFPVKILIRDLFHLIDFSCQERPKLWISNNFWSRVMDESLVLIIII